MTTKDLVSMVPQDHEQCAYIIAGEKFCGFFFAKHVGSFQHDFVRPPKVNPDDECWACGDAVCRGVKLVWAMLKTNKEQTAIPRKVCIRCASDAPIISLRKNKNLNDERVSDDEIFGRW